VTANAAWKANQALEDLKGWKTGSDARVVKCTRRGNSFEKLSRLVVA